MKFFASAAMLVLAASAGAAEIDRSAWKTDFDKRSIDLDELHFSLEKDRIPSIDDPKFESVDSAAQWLAPREPVVVVELEGEARAYPIRILLFHEIVNDRIGETPVAVTFCPLCNTALVFDRRVAGAELEFGVAGFLRMSDMIMHDRQTESLWQQASGEAIVGEYTGQRLKLLTGPSVPFEVFASEHPDGQVLGRPLMIPAPPYGVSHYVGYEFEERERLPAPLRDPLPVAPKERVIGVLADGKAKAHPFSALRRWAPIEGKVGKTRYVIFYEDSMLSAMDKEQIAESRAAGTALAFSPELDGERLKFRMRDGEIRDKQTDSRWNVMGRCVEGELKGKRLEPLPHAVMFAFAWAAFYPDGKIDAPTAGFGVDDPFPAGPAAGPAPGGAGPPPGGGPPF